MKKLSLATMVAFAAASLVGCNNRAAPAQQMVQQCGQSTQTGAVDCIMVPANQPNPYHYPAQQNNSGVGAGTVVGAAALGAAAGYLAGQANNQPRQDNATTVRNYPSQTPAPVPAATTVAPTGSSTPFKSTAAVNSATVKPMSIPPSAAKPVTPVPVSMFKSAPAAPSYKPANTVTPSFKPSPASKPISMSKPASTSSFKSSSARK